MWTKLFCIFFRSITNCAFIASVDHLTIICSCFDITSIQSNSLICLINHNRICYSWQSVNSLFSVRIEIIKLLSARIFFINNTQFFCILGKRVNFLFCDIFVWFRISSLWHEDHDILFFIIFSKHIRKPLQHISGIMIYKNIIIRIAYPAAYADHRIYSVVFIFVKFIPKFALCRFLLIFIKRRFKLHNSKIMIIIMIF